MSELTVTPAGLLIAFLVLVLIAALVVAARAWRAERRADPYGDDDGPVIDLTYLERAVKADEEAAERRRAEHKPLLSQAPSAEPDRAHPLPTDER